LTYILKEKNMSKIKFGNNGAIIIEGAEVLGGPFKNFAGKGGKFNREGDRNFCVAIDDPDAIQRLLDEGWSVKALKTRYEDEEPTRYLKVKVKYNPDLPGRDPKAYLISGNSKELLNSRNVGCLDTAVIDNWDLIITPYHWTLDSGASGISAYLKTCYATLEEDELSAKYADLNESDNQEGYDIQSDELPF
jgi:ribosomal protein L21E